MNKLLLFLILLLSILVSCDDEINTPTEITYGVRGNVIDSSGSKLAGVRVYCLFNYNSIPTYLQSPLSFTNSADSVFTNYLYQNFPNPVFQKTFIRYSVSETSVIEIGLKYSFDRKTCYYFKDTATYGLYQHYLGHLSQNSEMVNGRYTLQFSSKSSSGNMFRDTKDLFLIGTENKPNSISNRYGNYIFNGNEAFVGDTIKVSGDYDPSYTYDLIIDSYIYLLFKREGYKDKIVGVNIYPDVIYSQDVILEKDNSQ